MGAPTVFTDGWIAVTTGTSTGTLTRITGVKEIQAPFSRAELADAVMGDTIEAMYPGILSAPISVVCREDYDTSTGVNVNFYTRLLNRTKFNVAIKPTSSAASGTNPRVYYEGVYVYQANAAPSGAHGAAVENRIEFRPASGCAITYATST